MMRRCVGIGLILGHKLVDMTNVDREFYEPGPYDKEFDVEPVKREKVEHLYCVCTRCGQIVQKVKQSLFAEDGTK